MVISLFYGKNIESAPPTSVKDVLSSSQLSYFSRIGIAPTLGDSVIRIGNTNLPSKTTNNLFVGDTIAIGTTGAGAGTSGPLTLYTVADIGNTGTIQLGSGIGQSNAFINAAIIATRSAIHTISFTPQSNAAGGYWQFLIKATSRTGEIANDGIPDQQGFDLGATTPTSTANGLGTRLKVSDVTCPNWGVGQTTAFSVGTTTVINSNSYHVVTCYLGVGGTNQVGVGYSMAIGKDLATGSQLINPSPSTGHTEGQADSTGPDVYTFYIRHLDSTQTLIDADTAQGKIAVIEAVRVTATVDPTITFYIDSTNVGTGGTPCGLTLGANAANVTATQVPFGSLVLSSANDLAQRLRCVTNATGGYVVTAYENAVMKNFTTGTTIPDTTCPSNSCTTTSQAIWNTYSASGFGYTIHNVNVGSSLFHYTTGYKPFGIGYANAQQIMKNTATPPSEETAYVCYRVTASTTQEAGNYETRVIYTATATF